MDTHKIQLGYDNATKKHYACVVDENTGKEVFKTNMYNTVKEALQHVQNNIKTPHLKKTLPLSSEKNFPVIEKELNKRFCSS